MSEKHLARWASIAGIVSCLVAIATVPYVVGWIKPGLSDAGPPVQPPPKAPPPKTEPSTDDPVTQGSGIVTLPENEPSLPYDASAPTLPGVSRMVQPVIQLGTWHLQNEACSEAARIVIEDNILKLRMPDKSLPYSELVLSRNDEIISTADGSKFIFKGEILTHVRNNSETDILYRC